MLFYFIMLINDDDDDDDNDNKNDDDNVMIITTPHRRVTLTLTQNPLYQLKWKRVILRANRYKMIEKHAP